MSLAQVGVTLCALAAAVLLGCTVLLARCGAPRVLVVAHAGSATLVVAAAACGDVSSGPGRALALAAFFVAVPLVFLVHPDGRPVPVLGPVAVLAVVATGALVVARPEDDSLRGVVGIIDFTAVAVAAWWRFERAEGANGERVRQGVLWGALVLGAGLLVAGHAAFLLPSPSSAWVSGLVLLPAPLGLVVGTLRPDLADVRAVISRAVVETSALVLVVTVYVGTASALEVAQGHATTVGEAALVAALAALVLQPSRTALRGVVSRLLFGDRADPVRAASHVGARLGARPELALRALREALDVPHATLVAGGRVVASSGEAVTDSHQLDLLVEGTPVGRLDVGLRPGQVRLGARDRTTLDVLAPALAQAVVAQALTEQLQESRAGVIAAVEDERRRLRHDIHDGLGPTLTGIAFAADAARNTQAEDPERSHDLLVQLRRDAADAIVEVRRLVEGLRPPAVDEIGLVDALRHRVRSLHAADGLPLEVTVEAGVMPPLPAAVEVAAYRIVTEAITNVARHASCHEATVRLVHVAGGLCVEVVDGGTNPTPVPTTGVGLASMRERAEQLGGTFSWRSGRRGTEVRAVLPL